MLTPTQKELLKATIEDNTTYRQTVDKNLFDQYANGQDPQITLVTCADSRIPAYAIKTNTENQVFSIENIGNQIKTSEGSVDYGVLHLKTPLLLILGHTDCGAIKAVQGSYQNETEGIKRELDTLKASIYNSLVQKTLSTDELAELNVDSQVNLAMEKYKSQVENSELVVAGMMMDITGGYEGPAGSVYLTNLNGVKQFEELKKLGGQELEQTIQRITDYGK